MPGKQIGRRVSPPPFVQPFCFTQNYQVIDRPVPM